MTTETQTAPATSSGTGVKKMKSHIVQKDERGQATDKTLCGVAWDRLNHTTGELCQPCVDEYRKIRPGWPIPGGLMRG